MPIYLDHNATTPLEPSVLQSMLPYLKDCFGNPSSIHSHGQRARQAVDGARRRVARALGVSQTEVFFVSGGTEANNLALKGVVERHLSGAVPHVVTSAVEHAAVLATCSRLRERGAEVTVVGVDRAGRVDPEAVEAAMQPNTVMVSLMWANNDVGTLQPVVEVAALARACGVLFHTDAVQALGKIPVDLGSLSADLVSLSAHKIGGPKGAGALIVREGLALVPQTHGGGQERRRRGGTENVAAIVGFAHACELATEGLQVNRPQVGSLRDRMAREISATLPGVRINGHPEQRLPNTLNVSFDGVSAATLVRNLDLSGIACSVGAACASGQVEPSHVLQAMGLTAEQALTTVRFSLGPSNTTAEVDQALEVLVRLVARLRSLGCSAEEARRLGR